MPRRHSGAKRRGAPSADDPALLQRVRHLEDAEDRAAVARARKDKGSIGWAVIKRDLGLS